MRTYDRGEREESCDREPLGSMERLWLAWPISLAGRAEGQTQRSCRRRWTRRISEVVDRDLASV